MEDDRRCAARGRDARAAVECAHRRGELATRRFQVPHEAEERRVHGERHVVLARHLPEPLGPRVVHPEARLEVDFAGVVALLEQELDRRLGALPRRNPRWAEAKRATANLLGPVRPTRLLP